MDESIWFGSLYNVIALFAVFAVVLTQVFNLSAIQIFMIPGALISAAVVAGGSTMLVMAAVLLFLLYFAYMRFSLNDFSTLAIFALIIFLVVV